MNLKDQIEEILNGYEIEMQIALQNELTTLFAEELEALALEIAKLPQREFDETKMLHGDRMQEFYDGKIRGWNEALTEVLELIRSKATRI